MYSLSLDSSARPIEPTLAMDSQQDDSSVGHITRLCQDAAQGDEAAKNELFEALYSELRRRAGGMMARQRSDHTLQATALVSEAYLRLFGSVTPSWSDRRHFVLAASKAMRHLLVDHARGRAAAKREGKRVPLEGDVLIAAFETRAIDFEALEIAIKKLAEIKPEMARAVELQFFGSATQEEAAKILDIPVRTFQRQWSMARAWLFRELT